MPTPVLVRLTLTLFFQVFVNLVLLDRARALRAHARSYSRSSTGA